MSAAAKRRRQAAEHRIPFRVHDAVDAGPASGLSQRALDDLSRGAAATGMVVIVDGGEVKLCRYPEMPRR